MESLSLFMQAFVVKSIILNKSPTLFSILN